MLESHSLSGITSAQSSHAAFSEPSMKKKRDDYIDWDDYFMGLACLASKRSKDPNTQVGACIVNQHNRIVGQGYNGMPVGCSDDEFPWDRTNDNPLKNKFVYVCHAEMNAVLNRTCADIRGCKLYSVLFPCNQCTKTIIQSGIKEVIYMSGKKKEKTKGQASIRMLDAAGVVQRQYTPSFGGVIIHFDEASCNKLPTPNRALQSLPVQRDVTKKRNDYLDWEEYFMALSLLVSLRSKDPILQRGACIINKKKRIVSQGYNGMPCGCHDDDFPWGVSKTNKLDNKDLYECHAELNAILNSTVDLTDCVMYSVMFPCHECAKAIIQSGISEVVYLKSRNESSVEETAADMMFNSAGVTCRRYNPVKKTLEVDFTEINWATVKQLPPAPCESFTHLAINESS